MSHTDRYFNPRTRTGCDINTDYVELSVTLFQSTHPHGVRRQRVAKHATVRVISIHAPARGATWRLRCLSDRLNFNPRTRTGCDIKDENEAKLALISIHAPARGATIPGLFLLLALKFQSTHPHGVRQTGQVQASNRQISIHAPARGATPAAIPLLPFVSFQSTHPHGVRRPISRRQRMRRKISIHAPARGATRAWRRGRVGISNFNPRTRTGCDQFGSNLGYAFTLFQSTHPHGVRQRKTIKNPQ